MGALARFRAKANGGINPLEATRRQAALEAALKGEGHLKSLPPPMPHFGGPSEKHLTEAEQDELAVAREIVSTAIPPAPAEDHPAELTFPEPPRKTVTITISGEDGTTTLTHLVLAALADKGLTFEGPENLRSMNWRAGLSRHLNHDLRVVVVRQVTEPDEASE